MTPRPSDAMTVRPAPTRIRIGDNKVKRIDRGRGFTLVELAITVAIAALLATMAAPPMAEFIRAARLTSTANQLQADLQLARREAIKRNTRVLVCPGTSGTCPSQSLTGTLNWANGWRVCYDRTLGGQCDTSVTSDPNPIRVQGALDSSLALTGPAATVRFNADGTQGAAAGPTRTFSVTGTWSGARTYTTTVPATGNVALAKSS